MSCLDPEAAYVGALLWLPVDRAARAARLVETDDLADPRLRVILGLVRDVVADGARPDPVVVLAHARATGIVTSAHGIAQLSELIAAVYAECPLAGSVGFYAAAVLDQSLRRRCAVLGMRVGQVAESGSLPRWSASSAPKCWRCSSCGTAAPECSPGWAWSWRWRRELRSPVPGDR